MLEAGKETHLCVFFLQRAIMTLIFVYTLWSVLKSKLLYTTLSPSLRADL